MSYIFYCRECKKNTPHNYGVCYVCNLKIKENNLTVWNKLSTEEKLQDINRRLNKLECGLVKY